MKRNGGSTWSGISILEKKAFLLKILALLELIMDDSQLVLLVYFLELVKVELSRINRVVKQEEVFNLRVFYKNLTKRKSMESLLVGANS